MKKHNESAFAKMMQSARPDIDLPAGFKERLLERLKAHMRAGGIAPAPSRASPRRPVWALWALPATAAAVLVAVVAWWLVAGGVGTASADFAEVLRRIRQASTVAFDQTLRAPGLQETRWRFMMASPGRTRITRFDGKTQVLDHSQGRYLSLSPGTKKAGFWALAPGTGEDDPLDRLKKAEASAGQLVARERLRGQETAVYQVALQDEVMRVWVDPREELPVRIEVRSVVEGGQEAVTVLDNFSWNLPIPDSEFSLEVPPGYTLDDSQGVPTEESLIMLLRTCAQIGHGSFPASLDSRTVLRLVLQTEQNGGSSQVNQGAVPTITYGVERDDQLREVLRNCLGGLAFIEQAREVGQWRYVGGAVKLGDGNSAVCWWRPAGSASYRVVYADLRVRDVAVSELPEPRGKDSAPDDNPEER